MVVGLELRQELTTGSLSNVRAAAVPMLCAVGGMLVPPVLFVAVISLFSNFGAGDPGSLIIANGSMFSFAETAHGWAIPTATDIAFSLAVLALFAKALPYFDPCLPDDARHGGRSVGDHPDRRVLLVAQQPGTGLWALQSARSYSTS